MVPKDTVKKKMTYPTMIIMLLSLSFLFGGAAAIVAYATGDEVSQETSMMMISHTEYRFSEPGQIISRLVDFQGNPVVVTNCTATILYPDKSFFVQDALMADSTNITGDHYYAFTTPAGPEGVYEYQSTCTYAAGAKTASVTNSFHLSSAFSSVLGNLTQVQSDLESVNSTLVTQIANLNSSLQVTEQNIINELGNVNSSLYNEMNAINTSLTNYIGDTFNDLNASFGGDIENVLTEIDNLQTNINNQLACGGADNVIALNEGPSAETWARESATDTINHGIAFTTNFPNTYLGRAHIRWAPLPAEVSDATLFDENFTVITQGGVSVQSIDFEVNLPYAGKYYILGHRGAPGNSLFRESNTTSAISFSNTLYTFDNGFACSATEYVTCAGYASTGGVAWNFDQLELSVNTTTGEADMCQLIRDVNTSIQTALEAEFDALELNLAGNFSVVTTNQEQMNVTLNNMQTDIDAINVTTTNTYEYMTGTLATNVNSILGSLGVINDTVNRIETYSDEINTTTAAILANQEAEVVMTTFSG